MTTTVIYPGTFDPFTNGHHDLVIRAGQLFDGVVVAIAANPGKEPMFSLEERVRLARQVLEGVPSIRVMGFDGLLIDCMKKLDIQVVLRGLRAVSDFEYEFQLATMNRRLDRDIETVFLTPAENHTFISASLVREIARLGGNVSEFVHPIILEALQKRLSLVLTK